MTKQEIEEEISRHLNAADKGKRKSVEESVEYILAMKDGDLKAALRLALGILYGSAKNMTEHHRLMKKKRKMDRLSEFA
jgi:hypothetical protein